MFPSRTVRGVNARHRGVFAGVVWLRLVVSAALATWLPTALQAHEPSGVVQAFVKVEPGQVRVLTRVPLDLLADVGFVTRGRKIQPEASAPAVARAIADIEAWLWLTDGPIRLRSDGARARLTLPSDRSFDSYSSALTHIEQDPAPADAVFMEQGFLDAALTFPTMATSPRVWLQLRPSARFSSQTQTSVQYLPLEGGPRSFVATSRSGWLPLEARTWDVLWWFARAGLEELASSARYPLLLLCLIVSVRTTRRVRSMLAMVSVSRSAVVVGMAYSLGRLGAWVVAPADALATASLAGVLLTVLLAVELDRWVGLLALLGLLYGLVLSVPLRDALPLARDHELAAVLAFNLGLEAGQLVVVLMGIATARVGALVGAAHRVASAPLLTSALIVVALHAAWHLASDRGATLWTTGVAGFESGSVLTLARWVAGLAVLVVVVGYARHRMTIRSG